MKRVMLLVVALSFFIMPIGLFAQQEKTPPPAAPSDTQGQTRPKHKMSEQRMKKHEEMMSRMKEMDARLDEKVAAMDAAKGDQKVEAIAAVIKEMVAQRKDMREHMMKMRGKRGHMMEHRHKGMMGDEGKEKSM